MARGWSRPFAEGWVRWIKVFWTEGTSTHKWRMPLWTGTTSEQERENSGRAYGDSDQAGLNGPTSEPQGTFARSASTVCLLQCLFRITHSPFLSIALADTLICCPSTDAAVASFKVYCGG